MTLTLTLMDRATKKHRLTVARCKMLMGDRTYIGRIYLLDSRAREINRMTVDYLKNRLPWVKN